MKNAQSLVWVQIVFGAASMYAGFLTGILVLPMLWGQVKMGPYGVRMKESFASEENWYRINHYGAKTMLWAYCLPNALLGIGILVLPNVNLLILFSIVMVVHVGLAVLTMAITKRYAKRL
jgi:SdpI/YfhL protein family